MNQNQLLIENFYKAFQAKDFETMQNSYAENAIFSDPVFVDLEAIPVKAMWQMFCLKSKDLDIEFDNVKASADGGSADWTARYTFYQTGHKVVNKIHSVFIISNGQIVKQVDTFNFYKWSIQALGITGVLIGWTGLLKNKIRRAAKHNLTNFIEKNS